MGWFDFLDDVAEIFDPAGTKLLGPPSNIGGGKKSNNQSQASQAPQVIVMEAPKQEPIIYNPPTIPTAPVIPDPPELKPLPEYEPPPDYTQQALQESTDKVNKRNVLRKGRQSTIHSILGEDDEEVEIYKPVLGT